MIAAMNKNMRILLGLMVAMTLFFISTAHAASSAGKEFYFTFPPSGQGYFEKNRLLLYIASENNTQGTVEIPGVNFRTTFTVQANKVTSIEVPNTILGLAYNVDQGVVLPERVQQLAVHVLADSAVTVYGLNWLDHASDGFLALPIEGLGTDYYAVGYNAPGGGPRNPAQVDIIAAYNNTQVVITPASDAANGRKAGIPFTIALNRGETFRVTSEKDVTGLRVQSNAPVAVMSGVDCANVTIDAFFCNHLVEMLPPVSSWGTSFFTSAFAGRQTGDVFRMVASQDNTKIMINGVLKASIDRGQYFETTIFGYSQIEASAPVLIAQYSKGTTWDGLTGDPSMMLVVPTDQFLNKYQFTTTSLSNIGFLYNFVNVVIPTREIGNLLLDGVAVDPALFSRIELTDYSSAQIQLDRFSTTHTMSTLNGARFGLYIYAFNQADAYSYPAGMTFKPTNQFDDPYYPTASLAPIGDVIQGTAIDGEDVAGNGVITPRSGDVGGKTVRDSGISKIELLTGAQNLKLNVSDFIPGTLAVKFTISRVNTSESGSGMLHIEDVAGNKYEVPVELSSIPHLKNVRVIQVLSANGIDIDVASFTKPPFSVLEVDDKKIIEWRFDKFSSHTLDDLGFDILFKDPKPGERRLVSQKVELLYNDVNGNSVRTELEPRFIEVTQSAYVVTAATDKPSYAPNETVLITEVVKNIGASTGTIGVRVSIKDANNIPVASLGVIPAQQISAGASATFGGINFSTGTTYVGKYNVVAELVDAANNVVATGTAPFVIASGELSKANSTVATDKQLYSAFDTVRLAVRTTNTQLNSILTNVRAISTVTNPDGSIRFTAAETIPQLLPGAMREFAYALPLNSALAGKYNVKSEVISEDGKLIAQSTASYTVTTTADSGSGLKGSITALPKQVPLGESASLAFSVINNGNDALINLPLKVAIVDPAAQKVIAEFSYVKTLNSGNSYNGGVNWTTSGAVGATYVATLSTVIAGKTINLAQDNLSLVASPIKLDIDQSLFNDSRVLVLLSCDNNENKATATNSNTTDKSLACLEKRSQIISQTLGVAGIFHKITKTEGEFKQAFRSGLYNTYWISGMQAKLDDGLVNAIREAIFGGDSMILDGLHDQRNSGLDQIAGVTWKGVRPSADMSVDLSDPIFGQVHLLTVGTTQTLQLSGGVQHGVFSQAQNKLPEPALISNFFGRGRALTFALDLVANLEAQNQWQTILVSGLQYIVPLSPAVLTPGSPVSVKTSISNLGSAVDIVLNSTLPAGGKYVSSNQNGTYSTTSNAVSWAFALADLQTRDVFLTLQVPSISGQATVKTTLGTVKGGVISQYGEPIMLPIALATAAETSSGAINALRAYSLTLKKELDLRASLVNQVTRATAFFNKNTVEDFESAIGLLLDTTAQLNGLASVDTTDVRLKLGRILREAQWRWSQLTVTSANSGLSQ